MDCGFLIRRVYCRSDVQGLRADHLSVNPRATLKPVCIGIADSNSMKIKVQTRSVLSTTSKQCFEVTSPVLSAILKLYFEQPVFSSLVRFSLSIKTVRLIKSYLYEQKRDGKAYRTRKRMRKSVT